MKSQCQAVSVCGNSESLQLIKIILFNIHTCTHRLLCIRYLCGTAVLFNKERHSKWCVRATEGEKWDLAINPLAVSNLNTLVDLLSKKLSCDPRYEIAFFFSRARVWCGHRRMSILICKWEKMAFWQKERDSLRAHFDASVEASVDLPSHVLWFGLKRMASCFSWLQAHRPW